MSRARVLIERGDTLVRNIDWDSPDGYPIDLTGYTVVVEVLVGAIAYELTDGDGLVVDPEVGQIVMTLTAEQTALFEDHFGVWRLRVDLDDEPVTTLAEGLVFVSFWE